MPRLVCSNVCAAVAPRQTITFGCSTSSCRNKNGEHFSTSSFNHLRQKLSGAAHERQSLLIFVRTRAFAHKNELRFSAAVAEDNFVAGFVQLAARALAQIFADFQQRFAGNFASAFKQRWTSRDRQHRFRIDVRYSGSLRSGFWQDRFLGGCR